MSREYENITSERPRRVRSKNGCLTCRRRRVRCDEQRPQCQHCERLGLRCAWRPIASSSTVSSTADDLASEPGSTTTAPMAPTVPASTMSMDGTGHTAEFWDFNDLIWQDTSALNPNTADWMPRGSSLSTILHSCTAESPNSNLSLSGLPLNLPSPASSTEAGHALVENFLDSVAPPILAAVEFGPRWTSTKMLFASLASASDMVRYAIMAFSALQIGDQDPSTWHKHKLHYDKAAKSFTSYMNDVKQARNNPRLDLQSPLATSFFLAYNALLTNRVDEAQSVLKEAAALVHTSRTKNFTLSEKRLFSWVRLVDARACLAGGEGAFLQETDSEAFSPDAHPKEELQLEADVPTHSMDAQIEEVLFDVLHSPGLIFYQRVQSIMARVSKIDPWHRSRGTVADETEVMRIAEDIRQDLEQLGGARPSLTDHAVSGRLSDRHLGWSIAVAITHSYRLYWANYEAAFIHLHRVAHKHLPVTKEVLRARTTIKRIARLLQQDDDRPLPVNFIWPLLMACCEEDILDERKWMIGAIRSMQSGTSNAKPIADVLEEVHRRQDATGHRVDVRQTSVDLFNMSFAVF